MEHIDVVDESDRYPQFHFGIRAIDKRNGGTTTTRIDAPLGGGVRWIQVRRSRALIVSYLSRGYYYMHLYDLAKRRQIAEFLAGQPYRSPDNRYLLYRVGFGASDPRVFLLDVQWDADDEAWIEGRRECVRPLGSCPVEVGTVVYTMPPRREEPTHLTYEASDVVWDLAHERVLFIAMGDDYR